MRNRKTLLMLLLAVPLLAGICWVLSRDKEPRYAGRTLSSWLEDYSQFSKFVDQDQRREAARAIQQIGSNAVPHLLRAISYRQPMWEKTTKKIAYRVSEKLPPNIAGLIVKPFPGHTEDPAEIRAEVALQGLRALGPAAEPAVPRLIELALDGTDPIRSDRATRALFVMRPYPKAAINRLLSEGSAQTRTMTLEYPFFLKDPSLTTDLLPSLIKCVHEGRGDVLMFASAIITGLKNSDPAGTLGILTNLASSPRPEVRQRIIQCIATFPYGPPVTPYLRQFLADPDPHVRREASNAVWAAENGLLSKP